MFFCFGSSVNVNGVTSLYSSKKKKKACSFNAQNADFLSDVLGSGLFPHFIFIIFYIDE